MSILKEIRDSLGQAPEVVDVIERDEALKEAEKLADLFQEIQSQPYIIPIERFAGLSVVNKANGCNK